MDFFAGFFGVAVELVCAGTDIADITNIAASVACSCFVMDPRKNLKKAIGIPRKTLGRSSPAETFFPLLFVLKSSQCFVNVCLSLS